jgi:hypothetical protein
VENHLWQNYFFVDLIFICLFGDLDGGHSHFVLTFCHTRGAATPVLKLRNKKVFEATTSIPGYKKYP